MRSWILAQCLDLLTVLRSHPMVSKKCLLFLQWHLHYEKHEKKETWPGSFMFCACWLLHYIGSNVNEEKLRVEGLLPVSPWLSFDFEDLQCTQKNGQQKEPIIYIYKTVATCCNRFRNTFGVGSFCTPRTLITPYGTNMDKLYPQRVPNWSSIKQIQRCQPFIKKNASCWIKEIMIHWNSSETLMLILKSNTLHQIFPRGLCGIRASPLPLPFKVPYRSPVDPKVLIPKAAVAFSNTSSFCSSFATVASKSNLAFRPFSCMNQECLMFFGHFQPRIWKSHPTSDIV